MVDAKVASGLATDSLCLRSVKMCPGPLVFPLPAGTEALSGEGYGETLREVRALYVDSCSAGGGGAWWTAAGTFQDIFLRSLCSKGLW